MTEIKENETDKTQPDISEKEKVNQGKIKEKRRQITNLPVSP